MALIKWDDSLFSVKNDQMDSHHKKLLEMINQLHSAMMRRTGRETLPVILSELKSYAEYHFRAEERLMLLANYPDYIEHKQKHHDFVIELEILCEKNQMDKREVGIDTIEFLKEWLFKHIQLSDKKYMPYLKNSH